MCQYERISEIKFGDSWGIDFHKGIGGCPIDTSLFILNNLHDATLLSKKDDHTIKMHQIAEEFSSDSPVNYTLENSRSAGPMLSALASIRTMGINGFRLYLSHLITMADKLKSLLKQESRMYICDKYDLGFVVMLRLYPNSIKNNYIGKDVFSGEKNSASFLSGIQAETFPSSLK